MAVDGRWLTGLLVVAQSEARERGHKEVWPHHLALAITRDAASGQFLARLDRDPRVWRDYINYILGVNTGMTAARAERVRPTNRVSATELYYEGRLTTTDDVRMIIEAAREEAGELPIGPAHVLAAIFTSHAGDIAAGTARWLGVTLAAVRDAGGLSARRPALAPEIDPANLPQPDLRGPLVLLGGGPTPHDALRAAVTAAGAAARAAQVAWVSAAHASASGLDERQQQFAAVAPNARVVDIGLCDRTAASDRTVIDALDQADVVFLEGGKVELLYASLAGTPALDALVRLSERGGVVVGYSAGAMVLGTGMLSEWMSSGARLEAQPLLGWLPNTVIHAHASGDAELAMLRQAVAAFPGCDGLGIAHGGAVYIPAGINSAELLIPGWDAGCVRLADADADLIPVDRRDTTSGDA